ncbi:hypothetical protein [Roseimicrobium gellanilyticum]|nr:hypothetical protein [Roseimicrobium gellanilyticum]
MKADLVVVAEVISVNRLASREMLVTEKERGLYLGPTSIAVVKISALWKDSGHLTRFITDGSGDKLTQAIFVPCDYTFDESPSDLTVGRRYVLFLDALGANMFHPIDPASTHVLHEGRVATFGVNHSPGEDFTQQSLTLEEFKKQVMNAIGVKK